MISPQIFVYYLGGGGFQLEFYTKITTAAIVFWNFPREIVCIISKSHDRH